MVCKNQGKEDLPPAHDMGNRYAVIRELLGHGTDKSAAVSVRVTDNQWDKTTASEAIRNFLPREGYF